MSPRTLRALAAALALLAAAWAARNGWEKRRAAPELLSPQAARAWRLTLNGPAGELMLAKEAEDWRIVRPFPFPADAVKVAAFLGALGKARLSGPLADDPERHGLFGVSSASATRVRAEFRSGPPLDLFVGRPGASPDSFFLRRAGTDEVREARGMGRWEVDERPGNWTDRVVVALDSTRVTGVRLRGPRGKLELSFPAGGGKKAAALLTALTRLEADEVIPEGALDAAQRRGLARPEFTMAVSALKADGEGSKLVLELAAGAVEKSFSRLVRVSGKGPVVYRMSNWRLEPFMLGPADQ